jgi:hypothetical protein
MTSRQLAPAKKLIDAVKEAQQKIRAATDHIKRMEGFTGGCSTSEDFADMHCVDALNILNRALAEIEGCTAPKPLGMDKPIRRNVTVA